MSENPITDATTPFVATTTPNIERAQRLLAIRQHPGFLDLLRISQDLAKEAEDQCTDFGGWDPQQIVVLKARAQAAKEHHKIWLSRIQTAIESGVEETRALTSTNDSPARDIADQSDFVRMEMLKKFEQMSQGDNRPAGSY